MSVVYLHGFASAGSSAKAGELRRLLAPVPVYSPSYPAHRPVEAVAYLTGYLDACQEAAGAPPRLLVGSSLGGCYALYLAQGRPALTPVLINPALDPAATLGPYVGPQVNMATGEPFTLRADDVEAMARLRVPPEAVTTAPLLLLDAGDELIDQRRTAALFQGGNAEVLLFDDGSHRFEHLAESLPAIRARLHPAGT